MPDKIRQVKVNNTIYDVEPAASSVLQIDNAAPTLAWGATSTVATVDGVDITVKMPANPNSDTKVTAVGNHYTPAADTNAKLTATASSTTAATWGSTDMVTGVTLSRDAKGHVTGVSVSSIQMPANPNVDTKVTQSESTATDERTILLHKNTGADPGSVTDQVYYAQNVTVQPSTGRLSVPSIVTTGTINPKGGLTGKLKAGGKTYTGAADVEITAADLGLGSALRFKGTTTTALTDGATTNPITINSADYTAITGDVVIVSGTDKELVWTGSAWEELGDAGSHSKVGHTHSVSLTAVASTSGTTTVATGSVSSSGGGATVVTGSSGTATFLKGVKASGTNTFVTGVSGGSGYLKAYDAATNGTLKIDNGTRIPVITSLSKSGYTPAGTVSLTNGTAPSMNWNTGTNTDTPYISAISGGSAVSKTTKQLHFSAGTTPVSSASISLSNADTGANSGTAITALTGVKVSATATPVVASYDATNTTLVLTPTTVATAVAANGTGSCAPSSHKHTYSKAGTTVSLTRGTAPSLTINDTSTNAISAIITDVTGGSAVSATTKYAKFSAGTTPKASASFSGTNSDAVVTGGTTYYLEHNHTAASASGSASAVTGVTSNGTGTGITGLSTSKLATTTVDKKGHTHAVTGTTGASTN